jgi:hypothetical protein
MYNNIVVKSGVNPNPSDGAPRGAAFEFTASNFNLTGIKVYNNTIFNDNNSPCFSAKSYAGLTGALFRNNLCAQTSGGQALSWVPTSTTNLFENNLWHVATTPPFSYGGTSYNTCLDFDNGTAGAASNTCADPGFYNVANFLFYPIGGNNLNNTSIESNATFYPPTLDAGTSTGMPAAKTTGIVNTLAATHDFGFYSNTISSQGAAWDIGAVETYIPYPLSPNLTSWSQYTPASCTSSPNAVASSGDGFVYISHHDASQGCVGLSLPLTLTVGQKYLVYWKLKFTRDLNDITLAGGVVTNAGTVTCGADTVDTWQVLATNATLETVRQFDSDVSSFNTDLIRTYLLTPTATNVTLKAEVLSRAPYSVCQDAVYFFRPITVMPVEGVCSTTKYRFCDPDATIPDCPAGETCS